MNCEIRIHSLSDVGGSTASLGPPHVDSSEAS